MGLVFFWWGDSDRLNEMDNFFTYHARNFICKEKLFS